MHCPSKQAGAKLTMSTVAKPYGLLLNQHRCVQTSCASAAAGGGAKPPPYRCCASSTVVRGAQPATAAQRSHTQHSSLTAAAGDADVRSRLQRSSAQQSQFTCGIC